MTDNILLDTDSYKASHFLQYPEGTEYVYSYIESRGGRWDKTVVFGLQMFLKRYLTQPITQDMINEATEFWAAHGEPFNREGWEYILNVHNGFLPVAIKALPEGTVLPTHNVMATIANTDPNCFWLTSFLETALLRAVWYPTTVATNSFVCKQAILNALEMSSDDPAGQIGFKLHDFGARGVSSKESAGLGGAAHLVNFMGSDTVEGVLYARRYYGAQMAGFSIPAAEHSTITSWGRENEAKAYNNMLNQFAKPSSLVAVVSDSYDLWNAIDHIWGVTLRQKIIDSGATIVVRPDSGDPTKVPVQCVEALGVRFGFTVNSKGYKVLPSCVRVIQGDGINYQTLPVILKNLLDAGWSADNLAFGMGGGLLQAGIDRDTQKFAMKCSSICVNGEWRDVFKDPITDAGKRSKKGRLALVHEGGKWETVSLDGNGYRDQLVTVFRNGSVTREWTFDEVREQTKNSL